jgi:endoglycosylceramidase
MYRYDRASDTFTYRFTPDPSVHAPTVIYVPPLHYPNGYTTAVTGARVISKPGSSRLELDARPGARDVAVTITVAR